MVAAPVYCVPAAGSHHHVHLDRHELHATIYLQGVSQRKAGLLQCWTNLPCLGKSAEEGKEDWQAIDIGTFSDGGKERVLVKAIRISADTLKSIVEQGKTLDFGIAWRVALTDDTGQPMIEWLTSPGSDAAITFHLAEEDSLQHLLDDLHVTEGAKVAVKEEKVAILLIPLELPTEEATNQSFEILRPSRAITAGAVWERTKPTWHTSRSLQHLSEISEKYLASMVVLQFSDADLTVVILPICTSTANVSLVRRGGALCAVIDQFAVSDKANHRVVMAAGPSCELHSLIRRSYQRTHDSSPEYQTQVSRLPLHSPLLGGNGLGFCSWEALGAGKERPRLSTLTGVLEGVENRVPSSVAALLIDDGWQHISTDESGKRTLKSFDVDPDLNESESVDVSQAPSRLAYYIQVLRSRFPHIKNYAVWITLAGYWDGLDDDAFSTRYGPLVEASLTDPFRGNDGHRRWWLPACFQLESFYNDYFSFLRESGISFVKVDDQADWEWIHKLSMSSSDSGVVVPSTYYDHAWKAMTTAAQRHFGDMCVVNCMALGHRFITYQSTHSTGSHLARNSDDTFPNVPKSHTWHIYHNALNACLTSGSGNLLLDPDMITSYMPCKTPDVDWADYHAAFRACFSASTIWLSDSVEVSNKSRDRVLDRLLAPSKDVEKTTSLGRPKTVQVASQDSALPLPDSVCTNLTEERPGPALKMSVSWQSTSKALFGVVLTAWNTRFRTTAIDCITEADIVQALKEGKHSTDADLILSRSFGPRRALFVPHSLLKDAERHSSRSPIASKPLVPFTIPPGSYRIFSIVSALTLRGEATIACVGLIDKYNGLMAVADACKVQEGGVSALLTRAGKCGFVVHNKSLAHVQGWTASIDGVAVHRDHFSIERMQDCTTIIIDMVGHLQTACAFNRDVKDHWRVDILKPR